MNNVNSNINQTAQMQNILKAQAAGAIQDSSTIKKQQEPSSVRHVYDPNKTEESNLESLHAKDNVFITIKKFTPSEQRQRLTPLDRDYQHGNDDNEENGILEQHNQPQSPGRTSTFKWLKDFFQAVVQAFSKPSFETDENPQLLRQTISLPAHPQTQEKESRGPAINRFLSGWLELSPETIVGLEKFLAAEASFKQDDYQLYLQRQMVKLVKESRRAMEEQQLTSAHNNPANAETIAKRTMLGVALLGFAYHKLKGKKKEKLDIPDDDKYAREEEGAVQGVKKRQTERRIRKAKAYLKQVERELEGALSEGADEETLHNILKKILEITNQINELSINEETAILS